MAFKFVLLFATIALVQAGNLLAPAALSYSTGPALAYHTGAVAPAAAYSTYSAPAITSQSANIYRSLGNLGQISTYSKTIDTPYSSVRKADVRISNPGLKVATAAPAATFAYHAAPAAYAATPAYAAPAAYAAAPAYATHATYAAPASYATAPVAAHHASPLLGVAYSAAPAVAHVAFDSGLAHYSW